MVIGIAGLVLLSRLDASSGWTRAVVAMLVTGIGIGAVFPTLSTVVQSAFPYRMLGTANAARQFFNNLGAVVGVPIMATIIIETLKNELPRHLPSGLGGAGLANAVASGSQGLISGAGQTSLTQSLHGVPPSVIAQVLTAVRVSLATGIQRAFLLGVGLAVLGFLAALVLPEIPLRRTFQDPG
jgi:branched-subunit amino acid transport protein AzlD